MADLTVAVEPLPGSLAAALAGPGPDDGAVRLYWLGQAGFVLQHGATRVVIDPYLSDHLARKYAGTELPHRRMMPAPVTPAELGGVKLVLCTHRHSDHMDPETLPGLVAANPGAPVLVPRAERARALALGVPEPALRTLDAGERLILREVEIEAVPAAHEELTFDAEGHCVFLGYVLRLGGRVIYHSGDCIPYPGQAARLRRLGVEVALLPVNGRDAFRAGRGVPGNFHLREALELCSAAGVRILVGHHYGLFDFNTVEPGEAAAALAAGPEGGTGLLAKLGVALRLGPGGAAARSKGPPSAVDKPGSR